MPRGRTEKKIDILGKPYKISYLDDIEMQGNMGTARRADQDIRINKQNGIEQIEETLLEETVARLAVGIYSAGYRREGTKHA
jgi:peptidyl-tRNA hydrolase